MRECDIEGKFNMLVERQNSDEALLSLKTHRGG